MPLKLIGICLTQSEMFPSVPYQAEQKQKISKVEGLQNLKTLKFEDFNQKHKDLVSCRILKGPINAFYVSILSFLCWQIVLVYVFPDKMFFKSTLLKISNTSALQSNFYNK